MHASDLHTMINITRKAILYSVKCHPGKRKFTSFDQILRYCHKIGTIVISISSTIAWAFQLFASTIPPELAYLSIYLFLRWSKLLAVQTISRINSMLKYANFGRNDASSSRYTEHNGTTLVSVLDIGEMRWIFYPSGSVFDRLYLHLATRSVSLCYMCEPRCSY